MTESDESRWDARYAGPQTLTITGSPFLARAASSMKPGGRLLELAGGLGEDALWLALQGFEVTLTDVSGVALEHARAAAAERGVALTTSRVDLERAFPPGPWDAIHCHHYIDRALFERYPVELAPGGVVALCHPTVTNLERRPRPSRRYLYEAGEMRALAEAAGLEVISFEEGWMENGKHEAQLVARRAAAGRV